MRTPINNMEQTRYVHMTFYQPYQRQSHPTPARGRAPTSGLMVEWSLQFEIAAGLALGSTSFGGLVLCGILAEEEERNIDSLHV